MLCNMHIVYYVWVQCTLFSTTYYTSDVSASITRANSGARINAHFEKRGGAGSPRKWATFRHARNLMPVKRVQRAAGFAPENTGGWKPHTHAPESQYVWYILLLQCAQGSRFMCFYSANVFCIPSQKRRLKINNINNKIQRVGDKTE